MFKHEINSNQDGFIENWNAYSVHLKQYFKEKVKNRRFNPEWTDEIEDVLILLKVVPSKQVGKSVVATVENFNRASEKLITFELVSTCTNYNFEMFLRKFVRDSNPNI